MLVHLSFVLLELKERPGRKTQSFAPVKFNIWKSDVEEEEGYKPPGLEPKEGKVWVGLRVLGVCEVSGFHDRARGPRDKEGKGPRRIRWTRRGWCNECVIQSKNV